MARIQISVSSDLTNNTLPIDLNGGLANFRLNISASFSGRGLTEGLSKPMQSFSLSLSLSLSLPPTGLVANTVLF